MDYVVFLLGLAFEIGIDGLADRGGSVWFVVESGLITLLLLRGGGEIDEDLGDRDGMGIFLLGNRMRLT